MQPRTRDVPKASALFQVPVNLAKCALRPPGRTSRAHRRALLSLRVRTPKALRPWSGSSLRGLRGAAELSL